jgi:aspartate racemase
MSWESTGEYYRIINEMVWRKLGGQHSAQLVLYSVDFDPIERAQNKQRWDDAALILTNAANALKRAGADFMLICTNTMHKVADQVEQASGLPLLHMIDATGNAIQREGMQRVGLIGTRFTMEDGFYQDRLQSRFGVETLIPPEADRQNVHRVIYNELCHGQISSSSRELYQSIIADLGKAGAEGVVLGCTEIPSLIRPGSLNMPVFDTTRLHAEAAVILALGGYEQESPPAP